MCIRSTYIVMAESMYGGWLGLLKWSLSQQGDGTTKSEAKPMSAENKAWLERVMKEAVKDEPSRMKEMIERFKELLETDKEGEHEEEVEALLDELHLMVEQIDMAKVFTKFGGLTSLLLLLRSTRLGDDVRAEAAGIIAALAQNNYDVQEEMFKAMTVKVLVGIYSEALSASAGLRGKIIMAISCIVRQHPPSEEAFTADFASTLFASSILGNESLVLRRAVFLAKALIGSDTSTPARVELMADCFLPHVIHYVIQADTDLREGSLMMLRDFCASPDGLKAVRSHSTVLLKTFETRQKGQFVDMVEASVEVDITPEQDAHENELLDAIKKMVRAS